MVEKAKKDLFQAIKVGEMNDLQTIKLVCKQLLTAIDFLHKNDIAHNDIKLDNIFLFANNQENNDNSAMDMEHEFMYKIKLADFGFANST